MSEPLTRFIALYQQLNKQQLHRLPEIYAEHVIFIDPAHRIDGLAALHDYFSVMYQRLSSCQIKVMSQLQQGPQAWLSWEMVLVHPRLAGGQPVTVEGATQLIFDGQGKVVVHRDYFDLGAMLYEQLPLVGRVVQGIKRRVGT
ncbi:MAG: nuclear transport factor 2 family protein [Aeromonas sp.]